MHALATNLADNLVNQRVLCKQLRNLGHIVYAANHGKEALEFLEKSTYWAANDGSGEHLDIILLDTEMPVMVRSSEFTTAFLRTDADQHRMV